MRAVLFKRSGGDQDDDTIPVELINFGPGEVGEHHELLLVGVKVVDEGSNGRVHLAAVVHERSNFLVAMHHGCVVFISEEGSDLLPAIAEDFSGDVDCDMSCLGDVGFAGDPKDFIGFHTEVLANGCDDLFERWLSDDDVGVVAVDNVAGHVDIEGFAG